MHHISLSHASKCWVTRLACPAFSAELHGMPSAVLSMGAMAPPAAKSGSRGAQHELNSPTDPSLPRSGVRWADVMRDASPEWAKKQVPSGKGPDQPVSAGRWSTAPPRAEVERNPIRVGFWA